MEVKTPTLDYHDTPDFIVQQLLRAAPISRKNPRIADFAAGKGQMLRWAVECWPKAHVIAADVDKRMTSLLRRLFPSWCVSTLDFLDPAERMRSSLLHSINKRVDLLLLNPPFSCRGGTLLSPGGIWGDLKCSTAMCFILVGFSYLSNGGEIRAVLPASCMSSDKDAEARKRLQSHAKLEQLGECGRYAFKESYASTILLRIIKASSPSQKKKRRFQTLTSITASCESLSVKIVRGSIPMHLASSLSIKKGVRVPLIHTTNLRSFQHPEKARTIRTDRSIFSGPGILLPRVGKPDRSKLAILSSGRTIALSDCVLALACDSIESAVTLFGMIEREWQKIAAIYRGTGAPYITVGQLAHTLRCLGVGVRLPTTATTQYAQSLAHHVPWAAARQPPSTRSEELEQQRTAQSASLG